MSSLKNITTVSGTQRNTENYEKFRELVLRYSEMGSNEGIRIIPFLSPEMPLFLKANSQDQKNAIDFMSNVVSIHEETLASGEKSINTKQLIWRALGKLSLVPGHDIFDRFKDDDIVLIYQSNQTIVFWNLQIFNYVSLSVEQMLFTPWHEVTKRDPEIHKALHDMAVSVISGKVTGTFTPNVPGHVVEEINSPECLRTWMELPWGSVLTRNGAFGGILIVQRMKFLD